MCLGIETVRRSSDLDHRLSERLFWVGRGVVLHDDDHALTHGAPRGCALTCGVSLTVSIGMLVSGLSDVREHRKVDRSLFLGCLVHWLQSMTETQPLVKD